MCSFCSEGDWTSLNKGEEGETEGGDLEKVRGACGTDRSIFGSKGSTHQPTSITPKQILFRAVNGCLNQFYPARWTIWQKRAK